MYRWNYHKKQQYMNSRDDTSAFFHFFPSILQRNYRTLCRYDRFSVFRNLCNFIGKNVNVLPNDLTHPDFATVQAAVSTMIIFLSVCVLEEALVVVNHHIRYLFQDGRTWNVALLDDTLLCDSFLCLSFTVQFLQQLTTDPAGANASVV